MAAALHGRHPIHHRLQDGCHPGPVLADGRTGDGLVTRLLEAG